MKVQSFGAIWGRPKNNKIWKIFTILSHFDTNRSKNDRFMKVLNFGAIWGRGGPWAPKMTKFGKFYYS